MQKIALSRACQLFAVGCIPVASLGVRFFSDVRANSGETPFYGANPLNDLGAARGSLNHLSARHAAGANLTFLDGHAAHFKYTHMTYQKGTKIGDPGDPDINWSYDGTPSQ